MENFELEFQEKVKANHSSLGFSNYKKSEAKIVHVFKQKAPLQLKPCHFGP